MKKSRTSKNGISFDTVMHVARNARINLTPAEAKKYQKELSEIISAFRDIDKVKTNVQPSFHPLDVKDVLRTDTAEKCLTREEALANTRHKEDGFFKGPRAV